MAGAKFVSEMLQLSEGFKSTQLVEIVLSQGEKFYVQEPLLRSASARFSFLLDIEPSVNGAPVLKLSDCSTCAFQLFFYWLCHRKLPDTLTVIDIDVGRDEESSPQSDNDGNQLLDWNDLTWLYLCEAWLFADQFDMIAFHSETVRCIQQLGVERRLSPTAVLRTFHRAPPGSPLRRAAAWKCMAALVDHLYTEAEYLSLGLIPGFVREFGSAVAELRCRIHGCYHPHEDVCRIQIEFDFEEPKDS